MRLVIFYGLLIDSVACYDTVRQQDVGRDECQHVC